MARIKNAVLTKNEDVNGSKDQHINELSIENAFDLFIKAKKRENLKERTIKDHKTHFKYLCSFLYKFKPSLRLVKGFSLNIVNEYIDFMMNKKTWDDHPSNNLRNICRNLSPTTINIRLKSLRCLLSYFHENGYIQENISKKIKFLKEDVTFKTFDDNDVKRLFAIPDKENKYTDLRNYVIMLLLADTGVRINQLLHVEMEDINLYKREIFFYADESKSRMSDTLSFSPQIKLWLARLIEENKMQGFESGFLFRGTSGERLSDTGFRKALREYGKTAQLKGVRVSPHTFRHYFATSFLKKSGGDVVTLKKLMAHESLQATMFYVNKVDHTHTKNSHDQFSPINDLF